MGFARMKDKDSLNLRNAIREGARLTDLFEGQAGVLVACFFDEVARMLADGEVVVIPGFGTFVVVGFDIPSKNGEKLILRDTVKFIPARQHKRLLSAGDHELYKANAKIWRSRRRNISSSTFRVKDMKKAIETPVTAAWKQCYIAHYRRLGIPLPVKRNEYYQSRRERIRDEVKRD